MNTEKFLENLLASQDLSDQQEKDLQAHKKEITNFLKSAFDSSPEIKYAGSREKGTMIRDSYDLDIVCYFPSSDDRSLKEIREDVAHQLDEKYLITSKASAERIMDLKGATAPNDFHIDVVPGRFIKNSKDVFLHVAHGDKERMQTNLKTHITHIADSGCVQAIRLVKLWAHRNNINIKTFILELFVVRVLSESQNKNDLKKSFLHVLKTLKDDFEKTQLEDPANSNNIVSQLLSSTEKSVIAKAAEDAFSIVEISDNIKNWQKIFCVNNKETNVPNIIHKPNTGFIPHSPHSTFYVK